MDYSVPRARAASAVRKAAVAVDEAAHHAYVAHREDVGTELLDLMGELFYLERKLLELPSQATPAAREFERAEHLDQEDVPF